MDPVSSDDNLHKGGEFGVRGMESVVATVSGYHGTERFRLIKLISCTGASYVGALAKSTTHLVCWELKGKKYDLAKSFGIKVINHRWFEDCFKEGRRLPEDSYIMKCGKEVGHLSWGMQDADCSNKKKFKVAGKSKMVLSDQSNRLDNSDSQEFCSFSADTSWSNSYLLNESHESGFRSSLTTSRHKRSTYGDVGSSVDGGPAPKIRQLIKRNNFGNPLNHKIIDCEADCCLTENRDVNKLESISQECVDLHCLRSDVLLHAPLPSIYINDTVTGLMDHENRNRTEESVCVDELSIAPTSVDLHTCIECQVVVPEAIMQGSHSLIDSELTQNKGVEKANDVVEQNGMLTSELSCVICFTEFSSTRGVLPCGHRFCYSCIQDWADRVIADRKIPTCPLCKANFAIITKLEVSAFSDQKIYSQTMPCSLSIRDVSVVPERENYYLETSSSGVTCSECRLHEPEDLLTSCHICNNLWVHSCCLDPPLVPWTCIHCREFGMLYHLYR